MIFGPCQEAPYTATSLCTPSQTLLAERGIIPYSLKHIDVSRTTRTNLDVKQEKRIDDYWNIDGSRNLSDLLDTLEEKPPTDFCGADGRIKTPGGDQELRTSTLVRHRPIQGESNITIATVVETSNWTPKRSWHAAGGARLACFIRQRNKH